MRIYAVALALTPLLFPLYLVRFDVAGVPTTLLEVYVGLLVLWGLWLAARSQKARRWGQAQVWRSWRYPLWPAVLFLIASTVSMLMVPQQTANIVGDVFESARMAQGIWKGWIFMPLVFFFLLWVAKRDDDFRVLTGRALLLSGLGLSVWALVQMVTGEYTTWDGRASGPFESANYLSLYLAPVFLYALVDAVCKWRDPKARLYWKAAWLVAILVLGAALWGTQSYASFIALGAGMAFYLFFHPRLSSVHRWGAMGAAVVVAGIFLLTQIHTPKFQQFLDFDARSSSSVRIEVYEVAIGLIREHPLFGIGLGQFEVQYNLNAPEILGHPPYEWVMLHPHNLALAFWLNTGLLGLLAMLWLVASVFVSHFKNSSASSYRRIAFAMWVVMLVHGLFDTPFFKNDLAYFWWWVVAMAL